MNWIRAQRDGGGSQITEQCEHVPVDRHSRLHPGREPLGRYVGAVNTETFGESSLEGFGVDTAAFVVDQEGA